MKVHAEHSIFLKNGRSCFCYEDMSQVSSFEKYFIERFPSVYSSYDRKEFKIHPDIISLDEHNEIIGIIDTEPRLVNYQVYPELFLVDSKFCVQNKVYRC